MTAAQKQNSQSAKADGAELGRLEMARMMAFAFCSSDALVETDSDGKIVFASGATRNLFGHAPDEMTGLKLDSLCTKQDKAMFNAVFDRVATGERFQDVPVNIDHPEKPDVVVSMNGYGVPDLSDHCFITARAVNSGRDVLHGGERNAASGLLTAGSFGDNVKAHLESAAKTGDKGELSFFGLSGMSDLAARLGENEHEHLLRRLGILLKSVSQDGDAAAQLGHDRFGLLHDADLDLASVEGQISEFARVADPEGIGISVTSQSVDVEALDLSKKDVAQAVVYSIQHVALADEGEDIAEILSEDLDTQINQAANKIAQVKSVITTGKFDIAYQAIVTLANQRPHHFEALVRLDSTLVTMNPFEFICFAEDVGLISEFDLAMCRKVIERLKSASERGTVLPIAVNISGRSIDSPFFLKKLRMLLAKHPEAHGAVMFEITETARITDLDRANEAIRGLRADGFHVCLDDFGAGESAFEYLRELEVDYVKIDGKYVKDAVNSRKDRAFLVAMSSLCRDLGIATIAEFIEDDETLDFLKECGVAYGQGYLFHKPDVAADLSGSSGGAQKKNMKRKGAVTSWG